ncbi:hypothetical protein NEISICOT_01419 [Neisseria sicca ATCC 29256]|uniref:Uncharacterized protein n=1 Tax=Neisseria sicca ATCC 29256 TaxID=547045 RepID=C6M4H3_NEISI|nr:hypothetical protein NEISICOT_01419 [Neisseria sicca ATCC 29256]
MKFSINKEIRKMLELIDKSARARRFMWAALAAVPLTVLLWKLPEILSVLK